MKKIAVLTLAFVLATGVVYAEEAEREERRHSIWQLRNQLSRMKKDMDYLMRDIFTAYPWGMEVNMEGIASGMSVDVIEKGKSIIVKADMPGMDKDKIEIKLENKRILTISGERDVITEEIEPGLVRQERIQGRFERVLKLPAECETKGITASYENGVLEIVIPKAKRPKAEAVKIEVQ